jgi:hypothetical protein
MKSGSVQSTFAAWNKRIIGREAMTVSITSVVKTATGAPV